MNIIKATIGSVNRDTKINTRPLNEATISQYRHDMANVYGVDNWQTHWGTLPKMTEDKTVFGGFHTLKAAEAEFGLEHVVSFVVEGSDWRAAYFLATGENATHGLQRTNEEKRNSVLRWLLDDDVKTWSNSYIAKRCRVSHTLVANITTELFKKGDGYTRPAVLRQIDRWGKETWKDYSSLSETSDYTEPDEVLPDYTELEVTPEVNVSDTSEQSEADKLKIELDRSRQVAEEARTILVHAVQCNELGISPTDFAVAAAVAFEVVEFNLTCDEHRENHRHTYTGKMMILGDEVHSISKLTLQEARQWRLRFEQMTDALTAKPDWFAALIPNPETDNNVAKCKARLITVFRQDGKLNGKNLDYAALIEEFDLTQDEILDIIMQIKTEAFQQNKAQAIERTGEAYRELMQTFNRSGLGTHVDFSEFIVHAFKSAGIESDFPGSESNLISDMSVAKIDELTSLYNAFVDDIVQRKEWVNELWETATTETDNTTEPEDDTISGRALALINELAKETAAIELSELAETAITDIQIILEDDVPDAKVQVAVLASVLRSITQ